MFRGVLQNFQISECRWPHTHLLTIYKAEQTDRQIDRGRLGRA